MPVYEVPRNNLTATTDPSTSNDETEGYDVGSVWINTTSALRYSCQDASVGAAVWVTSSGGAATLSSSWRFSTNTTAADPGSRNFRLDNATQSSATNIYFSDTAESGVDTSNILLSLESGDRIYIQDAGNSGAYCLASLSGTPTDNTGWVTVPITVDDAGLDLTNNRSCAMIFLFSAGAAGGGEANLGQNVGTAGVGVFKQKSGVTLQFKNINAGSSKITITDDTGDDEIDIDAADASETQAGVAELATQAETDAGTDDARIVTPLKLANTTVAGIDSDAIHDNVASEISAVTEKTTPVGADLVLIEDSEDSNNKKRLQLTNLVALAPSLDTWRFVVNGKPIVETEIDGAWIAPRAGTFTRITLYRRTAGTGGSTIVDVNKGGTTLYTTQGNRPTVTAAGGNDQIDATTDFDVTTFAQNDRIEVDIDQIETGNPQDVTVVIEVQYT